jgi:hypothetical protein
VHPTVVDPPWVISWASWATPRLTLITVATAAMPTSTQTVTPPPTVEKVAIAVESWGSDDEDGQFSH